MALIHRLIARLQSPLDDSSGTGTLNLIPDADAGEDGGGDTAVVDLDGAPGPNEDRGDHFDPVGHLLPAAPVAAPAAAPVAAPAPAAAAPVAAPAPATSAHVPIGRLNEVIEQRRLLEAENAALRAAAAAGTPVAPAPTAAPVAAFDERASERQYAELLADGEFDKAADLRVQINANVRASAREEFHQEQAQLTEGERINAAANQAADDFPYLNTAEGEVALIAIAARRDHLRGQGVSTAEAITQATAEIAPKFGAAATATPGKELPAAAPRPDTRSTQAVERGTQQATRQPPVVSGGAGGRTTGGEVATEDMSEAQFEAMSPQEKARRRGD